MKEIFKIWPMGCRLQLLRKNPESSSLDITVRDKSLDDESKQGSVTFLLTPTLKRKNSRSFPH